MNYDTLMLLALQRMRFLTTSEKLKVLKYCSIAEALPHKEHLAELIGRQFSNPYCKDQLRSMAEKDLSLMLKFGINTLFIGDRHYPSQLKEIYNPPFLLYYRGCAPPVSSLNISVVGTRNATGKALGEAYALSFDLARSGAAVISGLAEGIDSAAHEGAVAGKNYTAAVLGSGIDVIYPASNKKLVSSILDNGGALISEYPPGTVPYNCHFPERNRIISALSEATVIVESPRNSGSLITADFALEQGREVYVLHIQSETESGAGTLGLIRDGATAVSTAQEVLNNLSYKTKSLKEKIKIDSNLSNVETGQYLAARFLAELNGKEVFREGTSYCL